MTAAEAGATRAAKEPLTSYQRRLFVFLGVVALVLLYVFPGIGMWLPQVLYK